MNDKRLLKRVVTDSKVMLGKPVIKGTRITVEIIIEKLAYGMTSDEIIASYPFLKKDDIKAALLYAAKRIALDEEHAA